LIESRGSIDAQFYFGAGAHSLAPSRAVHHEAAIALGLVGTQYRFALT